jgi:hypothetical protein
VRFTWVPDKRCALAGMTTVGRDRLERRALTAIRAPPKLAPGISGIEGRHVRKGFRAGAGRRVAGRAGASPRRPSAQVEAAAKAVQPKVVAWRRDIHEHPELGNQEVRTAALVAKELKALGFEVREGVGRTGVVGVLKGGKPGKVVALRADMDALPVEEKTGLPFASKVTAHLGGQDPAGHARLRPRHPRGHAAGRGHGAGRHEGRHPRHGRGDLPAGRGRLPGRRGGRGAS